MRLRWPFKPSAATPAPAPDPFAKYSDGELYSAVLSILNPLVGGQSILSTDEELRRCAERIAGLRVQYRDVTPPRLAREFERWLDYYEKENQRCRADVAARRVKDEAASAIRRHLGGGQH